MVGCSAGSATDQVFGSGSRWYCHDLDEDDEDYLDDAVALAVELAEAARGRHRHARTGAGVTQGLSPAHTKTGRLQRALLDRLHVHERDGTLPTSARFLFYELVQAGVVPKIRTGARRADRRHREGSMSKFDVSKVNIVPYVSLADASVQDHSTMDKQFPGLHNDLLFLWAMVDCENGERYELVRCLSASAAFDFNLHECPTDLWSHPTNVRFPGERDLYWGPILWVEADGNQTVFPANMAMSKRHPITVSLGPKQYVWKEEDAIDVVLQPLPMNVTAIYVPGLPDDVGYTSSGCTVSGSIEGSEITGGYGGLDRMYCLPGMSAQVSKIAELEHYWFVWGSIGIDGRWETGNAMLGTGNNATATFHRQGEAPVIATNDDVTSKVTDRRQPTRASLSFGGRTFNFEATHNAAAAAVSLGIAWMHGTMQEEGGPTPVESWSTMEVIKVRATPRD